MIDRFLKHPERLCIVAFAALIVLGAIALRLDVCHADDSVGWLDAFFTSTSAVCVTGLTTRDTAVDFTRAGQGVIIVLIQLGGLGVMTFGALAFQLLNRRMSFNSQIAVQDMLFQNELHGGLRRAVRRILLLTLVVETVGAAILYAALSGEAEPHRGGVFEAVFLAVSAFCNAGFSVYSDSLADFRNSSLIIWTVMALIVVGGLGYTVLFELLLRVWCRLKRKREGPVVWSLNTRTVLTVSGGLILFGAVALMLTGLSVRETTLFQYFEDALFHSITTRTAGFNTVDFTGLSLPAMLVMVPLMFVGGSPGSCAGGIKTTTLCVWLAQIRARVFRREYVDLMDRRIPTEVVRRAILIFSLALLWNLAGIFLLAMTEAVGDEFRFEDVIFEQFSALGTVGLSTGVTAKLSEIGKLWIMLTMLVGRLGPLTIALAVVRDKPEPAFLYPVERVMIG